MPEHRLIPESREPSFELESRLNLREQYQSQIISLNETGVLEILPEVGELGIVGIDGKEYPMPKYEAIRDRLGERWNELKEKADQGFTELQLTPLAAPISVLKRRLEQELRKHAREGNLFATKRNPEDPNQPLELNEQEPVYVWNDWIKSEQNDTLVYLPKTFTKQNHSGLTKLELIKQTQNSSFPGWRPIMLEPNPFLSKAGQGKTTKGRKQLENNLAPEDYLKMLKNPEYQNESGLTIEDWLTKFLNRLHTKNEVSNDWNDDSAVWLLGNYEPSAGFVANGDWDRASRRAFVRRRGPGARDLRWGVSAAVRV